jgi:pimeloyl-ACP methyl ester carboxylesterase
MAIAGAPPAKVPSGFERQQLKVNGADIVMFSGGAGDPIVFLHGAGTASGFAWLAPWAQRFRVYVPYHPGFGESPENAAIASVDDYVLHYLELFDALRLDTVRLVGLSLGGWIAATLATTSSHRLEKLVLVGPAGLRIPEAPTTDIFRLKPNEIPAYLVRDPSILAPFVPDPDSAEFLEFLVNDYREMSSYARVAWERPYDRNLAKWLHRIDVPTLLMYGEQDRITPAQQSATWAKLIPNAVVRIVPGAGHIVLQEDADAPRVVLDFLSS